MRRPTAASTSATSTTAAYVASILMARSRWSCPSGAAWVAVVNEGMVARFTADGIPDRQIKVPAKFVTSLCFTGPDRDQLIVVTADTTPNLRDECVASGADDLLLKPVAMRGLFDVVGRVIAARSNSDLFDL